MASYFVPYIWMLIRRECGKVQLMFLLCRLSISKLFEATGSSSSDKVSVEIFLVKIGFLCESDMSYSRPFFCPDDGKYHSASALLVFFLSYYFTKAKTFSQYVVFSPDFAKSEGTCSCFFWNPNWSSRHVECSVDKFAEKFSEIYFFFGRDPVFIIFVAIETWPS